MIQEFRVDLHVHTVLSPCAAVEMIPPLIVQTALDEGIRLIAITDHNSSANVAAVQEAARDSGLTVLPGMEVQTQEEVHVLGLFQELGQLSAWQSIVDQHLPNLENNPEFFGEQFIVDSTGDYLGSETRLLLTSVELSLEECVEWIHKLGGLAIPAHVNRKANGLFANLGMVPSGTPIDALEISRHIDPTSTYKLYPQTRDYPLIQNGDVHHLDGFLGSSHLWIESPTLAEIHLALLAEADRKIEILTKS